MTKFYMIIQFYVPSFWIISGPQWAYSTTSMNSLRDFFLLCVGYSYVSSFQVTVGMTSIEVKTLPMWHQTAYKLFVNKEVEIDRLM